MHLSLKSDSNCSKTQINFFGYHIKKNHLQGKLLTRLYRKEMDQQSYIHWKLEHLNASNELSPFCRRCTYNGYEPHGNLKEQFNILTKRLIERAYSNNEVQYLASGFLNLQFVLWHEVCSLQKEEVWHKMLKKYKF